MGSEDEAVGRDLALSRAIGRVARRVCETVYAGWNSTVPRGIARATEAQVAAAALGYKPLYFDPWPEADARRLARLIEPWLPADAVARGAAEGWFVYRPAVIRSVRESDPALYRTRDETDFQTIRRLARLGQNGDLLGYGARSFLTPGTARVRVFSQVDGSVFLVFASLPNNAEKFARERALDIAVYTDEPVAYHVQYP
jgi:hypothetical protein